MSSEVYFNEFDPFASQWLMKLFPGAVVDSRSIKDVTGSDVIGFQRCHFFGGIGGWQYALQLAGWPEDRPVWSGSCPCQPFSAAGKQKGQDDDRHLWPEMFRLIRECSPATIFGEQVASKLGREWLSGVRTDLEALGYAFGAADLCAAGVGSPHIRQRLYWVAYLPSQRWNIERDEQDASKWSHGETGACCSGGWLAQPHSTELQRVPSAREQSVHECGGGTYGMGQPDCDGCSEGFASTSSSRYRDSVVAAGGVHGMGHSFQSRLEGHGEFTEEPVSERRQGENGYSSEAGFWSDFSIVHCTDGKSRRTGRSVFPLVNGIPRDMGRGQPELGKLVKGARSNRVGRLKAYGNAIVPQVAAEFIKAFLETEEV